MSSLPSLSTPPTSPHLTHPQPPTTPALTAEQVFDAIGPAYETAFANLPEQTRSIDWLLSTLTRPSRILDVGCGTGNPVCSRLANAGHSVLGIDVSAAMITAARQRVPAATFQQVDVRTFLQTAEPQSFDAVAVYFSLIASMTQDEIQEILKGLAGLLKEGGVFVWATVPIEAEEEEIRWMGRRVLVSSLAVEGAVRAVESAGLRVTERVSSSFLPRAVEAGICGGEDVWEEPHLFVYARKGGVGDGDV